MGEDEEPVRKEQENMRDLERWMTEIMRKVGARNTQGLTAAQSRRISTPQDRLMEGKLVSFPWPVDRRDTEEPYREYLKQRVEKTVNARKEKSPTSIPFNRGELVEMACAYRAFEAHDAHAKIVRQQKNLRPAYIPVQ